MSHFSVQKVLNELKFTFVRVFSKGTVSYPDNERNTITEIIKRVHEICWMISAQHGRVHRPPMKSKNNNIKQNNKIRTYEIASHLDISQSYVFVVTAT